MIFNIVSVLAYTYLQLFSQKYQFFEYFKLIFLNRHIIYIIQKQLKRETILRINIFTILIYIL